MAEEELQGLAAAWVAFQEKEGSAGMEDDARIVAEVQGLPAEARWAFIQQVLPRASSRRVLGRLAAGPLEDLIEHHGHQFIDEVERLAAKQPAFASLLREIWLLPSSDGSRRRYWALGCQMVSAVPS